MVFLALNEAASLPLKDIKVEAKINNFFADVSCYYVYQNSSDRLLESSFVFPIESGSVVYEFEVVAGNERFLGICRERHEVRKIFLSFLRFRPNAYMRKLVKKTLQFSSFLRMRR